jgi:hypothetical protein
MTQHQNQFVIDQESTLLHSESHTSKVTYLFTFAYILYLTSFWSIAATFPAPRNFRSNNYNSLFCKETRKVLFSSCARRKTCLITEYFQRTHHGGERYTLEMIPSYFLLSESTQFFAHAEKQKH